MIANEDIINQMEKFLLKMTPEGEETIKTIEKYTFAYNSLFDIKNKFDVVIDEKLFDKQIDILIKFYEKITILLPKFIQASKLFMYLKTQCDQSKFPNQKLINQKHKSMNEFMDLFNLLRTTYDSLKIILPEYLKDITIGFQQIFKQLINKQKIQIKYVANGFEVNIIDF